MSGETQFQTIMRLNERLQKLEAARPQWTREPPTKPGWYWVVACKGEAPQAVLKDNGDSIYVGDHQKSVGEFDGPWCGPIEAPPLPEGT